MDDLNLSSEQTEKILQYQDLTGIENMSVCRDALQRHGWDLEVAVQEQLNMSEGRPSVFASENAPPTVVSDAVAQQVFFAPPSESYRWGGPVLYFVIQFCYNSISWIFRFAYSLFWKEVKRQVTDPVGDVRRFIEYFNEHFSTSHPVFYQGAYNQALNDAKHELRFLLIYLHKNNNTDSNNFCRDCLAKSNVIDYITTHMLFWACNIESAEGERVSHTLKASTYPFLAVIVLKDSRMSIVGRIEGPMSMNQLVSRLTMIVQSNEGYLEAARSDRIARTLTQTIRKEQDAAYLESLRQDEEKERRRCAEEERKQKEVELERKRIEEEQMKKEAIRRAKIDLATEVPDEPSPDHPDALRVVFKMPSGERVERRFLNSHTLKDVYNYVFCHPSSPDSFEIATNFPKRTLPCSTEAGKSLKEAGLGRSEVLFVYDLDS